MSKLSAHVISHETRIFPPWQPVSRNFYWYWIMCSQLATGWVLRFSFYYDSYWEFNPPFCWLKGKRIARMDANSDRTGKRNFHPSDLFSFYTKCIVYTSVVIGEWTLLLKHQSLNLGYSSSTKNSHQKRKLGHCKNKWALRVIIGYLNITNHWGTE